MSTLTQLEYVLAVDRLKHFGKAAKLCNISQPTLSQQIQKLEEEHSIVIFDRFQKPILLTDAGKRFVEQAKNVVREHQRLLQIVKTTAGQAEGEFRLALIPTVSGFILPHFVQSFSKSFPKVELFIEELKTETILSELKNDRLDGAILATPVQNDGLKIQPLFYDKMLVYLSEGHPLLAKTKIKPNDLDENEMWMLQDGNCFKNQVASFCSINPDSDSVFRNIHFQSGSLETLRNIVLKSKGYTLVPQLMAQLMAKSELEKHVRPFTDPVPTREISFVCRRDHWKIEIIEAIKKTILGSLNPSTSQIKSSNMSVLEVC